MAANVARKPANGTCADPWRNHFIEQDEMMMSSIALFIAATALGAFTAVPAKGQTIENAGESLFDTVAALDGAVFDAFNHCSDAQQLRKHASYFAPDVEFYHDTGGVTWSRQEMLGNTEKHVCGHFRRELVPGTLRVFPIKDFGAIAQGSHRFCKFESGTCEGIADFVIVWNNQNGNWLITRVLSYGHRSNE